MQDKDTIELKFDKANLDTGSRKCIARIVVEDEAGLQAIGWFDIELTRGRVKLTVTARKSRHTETIVHATPDWVL